MDRDRFDALTVALAGHRRAILRTLAVATTAALSGRGAGEAGAGIACTPLHVRCKKNAQCCSGSCKKKKRRSRTGRCGCGTGRTACPAGTLAECCEVGSVCCPPNTAVPCCPEGQGCCPFGSANNCDVGAGCD